MFDDPSFQVLQLWWKRVGVATLKRNVGLIEHATLFRNNVKALVLSESSVGAVLN